MLLWFIQELDAGHWDTGHLDVGLKIAAVCEEAVTDRFQSGKNVGKTNEPEGFNLQKSSRRFGRPLKGTGFS
jgi:hypothetical protein